MPETTVKLVKARWVAPYEAQLQDNTVLVPGETVAEIPEPEAIASENWEIVGGSGAPTKADLKKLAEDLGVEVPAKAKKADIEKLIAEAQATPPAPESGEDENAPGESGDGEQAEETQD